MKRDNTAADENFKHTIRTHVQLASDFYKAFAGNWDDILPDLHENSGEVVKLSSNINDNVKKITDAINNKIWTTLSSNIGKTLQKISGYLAIMAGISDDIDFAALTGTQGLMAEAIDKQKNVVEATLGELPKPADFVENLSSHIVEGNKTVLVDAQKQAAKAEKSKGFAESLTKKEPIAKPQQSRWQMAKERAGKTADKTKEIIGGIGKVLKALLNPVALVAAFISKFLPYILIFGAMLYGAWQALGDELREKFTDLVTTILTYVGVIFLSWKLLPVLIKVLATVYQFMRIGFLVQEHNAIMTGEIQHVTMQTTEHTAKMGSIFKDFALRIVEFVRKIAATILDIVLRGIEFALKVAAIALAVVLIVAVIALIVIALGAVLLVLAAAAIKLFKMLFDIALKIIDKAIKIIIDIASFIFKGIGSIFGFGSNKSEPQTVKENKEKTEETDTEQYKMANAFSEAVAQVIAPLNIIQTQVVRLRQTVESMAIKIDKYMSSVTGFAATGPFSSFNQMSRINQNNMSYEAADNTSTLLDKSVKVSNSSEDNSEDIVNKLKDINENIKVIINNQIAITTNSSLSRPVK